VTRAAFNLEHTRHGLGPVPHVAEAIAVGGTGHGRCLAALAVIRHYDMQSSFINPGLNQHFPRVGMLAGIGERLLHHEKDVMTHLGR
jgi:hypothetical protein